MLGLVRSLAVGADVPASAVASGWAVPGAVGPAQAYLVSLLVTAAAEMHRSGRRPGGDWGGQGLSDRFGEVRMVLIFCVVARHMRSGSNIDIPQGASGRQGTGLTLQPKKICQPLDGRPGKIIGAVGSDGSYPAKVSRRAERRVAGLPSRIVGVWGMRVYNLVHRHDSGPVGQRFQCRVADGRQLEGPRRCRLVGDDRQPA